MSLFDQSDALSSYNHLIRHIVPGPNNISYFIAFLLFPLALLIPPSILSHRQLYTLFLPIIYALQLRSWWQMGGIDVISVNLSLWSFALLALKDPRRDFTRIRIRTRSPLPKRTKDDKKQNTTSITETWDQPYPPNIQQRLPWVLTLLISIRFTNWKINDPTHDSRQPTLPNTSRLAFTRSALRHIITGYVLLDLTSSYTMLDPYFHVSNTSIDSPLPYPLPFSFALPSFLHPLIHLLSPLLDPLLDPLLNLLQHILPRTIRTTILATQIYALIPPAFLLPTLPAIALNAQGYLPDEWSPHTWPPFFGPFAAVSGYGVRGLWGRWWHQFSREVCGVVGRVVVGGRDEEGRGRDGGGVEESVGEGTRREKENDWVKYLITAASTFFFSGIVHAGLIPPHPLKTTLSATQMRLYIAGFFWLQVFGFAVEIVAARVFPRTKGGRVRETLVLLWVFAWLSITLPMIVVPSRELGYWDVWPVPVSFVRWGWAGRWGRWF